MQKSPILHLGRCVKCWHSFQSSYTKILRKKNATCPAPHHTNNLKTKAPNTTGSNHLYNTLELLMMGTVVPETC